VATEVQQELSGVPYREVALAEPSISVTRRDDGSVILVSNEPLGDYHRQIGIPLRLWAAKTPDTVFLAERMAHDAWRTVSYAEARILCDALSQALLDRNLGPNRPLMILSENSINFALLSLAAMQVGIPVAPISAAYSLNSRDFSKLIPITELLTPGMVYVEDGERFRAALDAIDFAAAELVVTRDPPAGRSSTAFADLLATHPGPAVEKAFDRVTPDQTAKYLFTSGSTGTPKAVINTHRMLCSNQQASIQIMPFVAEQPPRFVEWLPWNHTAAGNMLFNVVLFNGGSYYIDEGRPLPGLFDKTLRNLRDVSPTVYFNVPAGFAALLPHLEQDKAFREHFFKDLVFVWYAGAALTQDLWDRFAKVAYQARGERVAMTSAFGTTESSPSLCYAHWPAEGPGNVGVPIPGCEVKLAPVGDKLEIRAKGPCMTPGYFKAPEVTAKSLDEEGYYCFGDAMKFVDPDDPAKGLLFDGRLSENFKLSSGTWVNVGPLRTDVLAAVAPLLQDLVICGHDRAFLGALAWPAPEGCREIAGVGPDATLEDLIRNDAVIAGLASRLAAFNETAGGSSRRIKRLILLEEPPQIDANEITDKGYVNQRAVLARRATFVESLFEETPASNVIVVS